MAVIDIFCYSGERDILKLHLSILDKCVDTFVIVEARETFSGKPKPMYFFRDQYLFKPWWKKIEYLIVSDWTDEGLIKKAQESGLAPNEHFQRAFYQKEYLQKGLTKCKDDDIILYGDVDEIANPEVIREYSDPIKLEQLMYTYQLNRRTSEPWKGTMIARYDEVKQYGLNFLRAKITDILPNGGWHFSNMGGFEQFTQKLDSYDHQEINTPEVRQNLKERYDRGEDFLGRNFTTWIEEENWPQHLKENKSKYKHLIWQA